MAITDVGGTQAFAYTGSMQSYTIPISGVYKIECRGAGGAGGGYAFNGQANKNGGKGGYSVGYKLLTKGQILYIGVGQAGGGKGNRFNGGRDSTNPSNPGEWYGCTAGAGCTHVATANGELSTLSGNKTAVLIVAGGGGSAKTISNSDTRTFTAGNGGGASGGAGTNNYADIAAGGTQTSGYAFGVGAPATNKHPGGGAGWYGGRANDNSGGAGGSGYIGGVPSFAYKGTTYAPTTTTGGGNAMNSNGSVTLTLITKSTLPVVFNGTTLEKIIFNGTEVKSLIYNGTKLFFENLKKEAIKCYMQMRTIYQSRILT